MMLTAADGSAPGEETATQNEPRKTDSILIANGKWRFSFLAVGCMMVESIIMD